MKRKTVIKFIIFLLGFFVLYHQADLIFTLKEYPHASGNINILVTPYVLSAKQDGFYSLKKNSLDAVFLGSSHIHCGINPNRIWDQYGMTTYAFSADKQDLGTTYYYLLEMFKTQSPRVVVIDIYDGGAERSVANDQGHFSFDHMKNDLYKFQAIWNRTVTDRLEMYIPLIIYHNRWKELGKNDLLYRPYQPNLLKGSFIYMRTRPQESFEVPKEPGDHAISERTLYWIKNILKVCKQHDCECLFIKTPIANYSPDYFSYIRAMEKYFDENAIPFLMMNDMIDEIGIDFQSDYADGGHLNWNGMSKLSSFIGKYLQDNYGIENKKGLPEYARWDEDYQRMMYYINNFDELYSNYQKEK